MAEAASLADPISTAPRWSGYLRRVLAILAGAVFVYAGAVKLAHPIQFATDITKYEIVSWGVALGAAFYLPWLEVLCGLALVFHRLCEGALLVTGALMVIFIAASVSAKARGLDVACGCFGSASSSLTFASHLLLDFVLLGILGGLWLWRKRA